MCGECVCMAVWEAGGVCGGVCVLSICWSYPLSSAFTGNGVLGAVVFRGVRQEMLLIAREATAMGRTLNKSLESSDTVWGAVIMWLCTEKWGDCGTDVH